MFKQYRADTTALAADDYVLQYSGKVNDIIPVCKYRSRKTGLRIVVAEVQGPLVNGYFCLGRLLVKCGIVECGMRKVKCGIQKCGKVCGMVGKTRNAERTVCKVDHRS